MPDFSKMTLGQIRARCKELEDELRAKALEHREARNAVLVRENEVRALIEDADPDAVVMALTPLKP